MRTVFIFPRCLRLGAQRGNSGAPFLASAFCTPSFPSLRSAGTADFQSRTGSFPRSDPFYCFGVGRRVAVLKGRQTCGKRARKLHLNFRSCVTAVAWRKLRGAGQIPCSFQAPGVGRRRRAGRGRSGLGCRRGLGVTRSRAAVPHRGSRLFGRVLCGT